MSLVVILNTLESIDANKSLSTLVYLETIFLESHALSGHKLCPMIYLQLLPILMDLKHICVNIAIKGEGILIILEHCWKGLDLIRQPDIHILRGRLCQLFNKIFKLIVGLVLHA